MKKCIVFSRVSSQQQHLESQEETVMEEASKRGYKKEEIYVISHKESGYKLREDERLGLREMYSIIEENSSIECVIVFELSRIARKPDIIFKLRDVFIEKKIQLVSLKPYMELLNPDKTPNSLSLMFFTFIIGWAETEMFLKNERTKRGRMRNKEIGKAWSGACSFGYYKDRDKYFKIDEKKASIVREIFLTYSQGEESIESLQREMESRGEELNVSVILHSRNYIGENNYPKMIDEDLFNEVQLVLEKKRCQPKAIHRHIYYAKGILFEKSSGKPFQCQCVCAAYRCGKINLSINLLDSILWTLAREKRVFHSSLEGKDRERRVKKQLSVLDKKIDTKKREIEKCDERVQKIEERLIYGKLTEERALAMEETIEREKRLMEKELVKIEAEKREIEKLRESFNSDELLSLDLDKIEDDDIRRKIVREEIKRVEVERKTPSLVELDIKYETEDEHNIYELYTKRRKCYLLGIEVPFDYQMRYQLKRKKQSLFFRFYSDPEIQSIQTHYFFFEKNVLFDYRFLPRDVKISWMIKYIS